jgi:hypothetical protein
MLAMREMKIIGRFASRACSYKTILFFYAMRFALCVIVLDFEWFIEQNCSLHAHTP